MISPEFILLNTLADAVNGTFATITRLGGDYTVSSYTARFAALDRFMVLVTAGILLLISFPFSLKLSRLYFQSDAVAMSFTHFPSADVRTLITELGLMHSKIDDVSRIALLPPARKYPGYSVFWAAMILSFLPLMALALVTHYSAMSFMTVSSRTAAAIQSIHPSFCDLWVFFSFLLHAFACDLGWDTVVTRETAMSTALYYLAASSTDFGQSLWGMSSAVDYHYRYRDAIPTFSELDEMDPPVVKSFFEVLATSEFPSAFDILMHNSKLFVMSHMTTPIAKNDGLFLSIWYYVAEYSFYHFVIPEIDTVHAGILEDVSYYRNLTIRCLIAGIIWQAFACVILVITLLAKHRELRNSLRFYLYLKPKTMMENKSAISLLNGEGTEGERAVQGFAEADVILSNLGLGIVLTNNKLKVLGVNATMVTLLEAEDGGQFRGLQLADVVPEQQSWGDFARKVQDITTGKQAPSFSELLSVTLPSGKVIHLLANVVSLMVNQVAVEGDYSEVDKFGFVFTDCTELVYKQQALENEQTRLHEMLESVIPGQICESLEKGEDSWSNISQSVTIGQIRVKPLATSEVRFFDFYKFVFDEFDEVLKTFDLLSKVRTCFNVYCFAGGLFSKNRKPAGHAEESVKFGIRLLVMVQTLANRIGCDFEIVIGIHTGGPVATGVMSAKRPTFQIIGPVMNCAAQMMETGLAGEVQLTRSTYELIFASGFRIRERGEIPVKGGGTMMTYLVSTG
jgi:hypothetical protein